MRFAASIFRRVSLTEKNPSHYFLQFRVPNFTVKMMMKKSSWKDLWIPLQHQWRFTHCVRE